MDYLSVECPCWNEHISAGGFEQWQPRPTSELNRDLGKRYGLPVEFSAKADGLDAIARALCRGDQLHARIATLHLRIPDPSPLGRASQNPCEIMNFAGQLKAGDLLKADWNSAKHPRWPAGTPDSIGGQFAPSDSATVNFAAGNINTPATVAQLTISAPFELPIPGTIPFPSEIIPPPVHPKH